MLSRAVCSPAFQINHCSRIESDRNNTLPLANFHSLDIHVADVYTHSWEGIILLRKIYMYDCVWFDTFLFISMLQKARNNQEWQNERVIRQT